MRVSPAGSLLSAILLGCALPIISSAAFGLATATALKAGTAPHLDATRQWAHYKPRKQRSKRQDSTGSDTGTSDGTPTTAQDDPSRVEAAQQAYQSPGLTDGTAITKSVQQQIKTDVSAAINEFKDVPVEIQNVVKTALNQIMGQSLYAQTPEQQYKTVTSAINNTLERIQGTIGTTLLALTPADASNLNDRANLDALRDCINTIVGMGGRKTEESGSCLTTSGYSLDSLREQFQIFTDLNTFVAPANAVSQVVDDVKAYLTNAQLVPATKDLIAAATASIENVVKTVSALDRDAADKAFDCFLTALQAISDQPLGEREDLCLTGNGNGVTGTALADVQKAYISKVNQYAGVLPPALAVDIQRIGLTAMTLKVGSYDETLRDQINTAINSQLSSTGGETGEIVSALINCLNTIYDDNTEGGADNTCNPNTNYDVLNSNANIYRDYLNSFVSILPKRLVLALNQTVQDSLEGSNGPDAQALTDQINKLFDQASLGTTYSDCTQSILSCTIDAMVAGTATTDCTDGASDVCKAATGSFPPFGPDMLGSNTSPYAGLGGSLSGDGNAGGGANYRKRQRKVRRAVQNLADKVIKARSAQPYMQRQKRSPLPAQGVQLVRI